MVLTLQELQEFCYCHCVPHSHTLPRWTGVDTGACPVPMATQEPGSEA